MKISVVIPAYTLNRWDTLVAAVESCRTQTLQPDEMIVVIDYNEDLFERATEELKDVRVVTNRSTKGVSGARNTGVAVATGDIIACLDDDAYASDDWLENLVKPLNDPTVAGVGGWILPHWPKSKPEWFPETFYWILGCSYAGLPETGATIRNAIGANMAIRRRVFELVGGFTEGIGRLNLVPLGCEETEIAIRYTTAFPDERFVMTRDAVASQWVPASRLTWHYFWSRCWSEGLSKAAVSHLVGNTTGLAAEREHLARAIPREFLQTLRKFPRSPRTASTRMALLVIGSSIAGAGLFWGKFVVRQAPVEFSSTDMSELALVMRGEEGPVPPSHL
jgi:glucosyl-dolichyl phosphate glucuronosyltransferase